jgi:hypothetical protein
MTQRDIDRAVALATGESENEIQHRGFGLADPLEVGYDPEPADRPPLFMDWDAIYPCEPPRH